MADEKIKNAFVTNIKAIIEQQITNALANIKTIKYTSGVAMSEEDINGFVKVRLVGDNKDLSFINKTGEKIFIGDTVFIEYYTTLTKGYISRRSGVYQQQMIIEVQTEAEAKTNYKQNRLYVVMTNK